MACRTITRAVEIFRAAWSGGEICTDQHAHVDQEPGDPLGTSPPSVRRQARRGGASFSASLCQTTATNSSNRRGGVMGLFSRTARSAWQTSLAFGPVRARRGLHTHFRQGDPGTPAIPPNCCVCAAPTPNATEQTWVSPRPGASSASRLHGGPPFPSPTSEG